MERSPASHAPGLTSYLTGFALALILTAIPFALVATAALPRLPMLMVIAVAAVIQVLVHLR
jgi:cytochrome o ubiquinol oxidase operon protein cyoD